MLELRELQEFVDRSQEPTNLEIIYYMFWDKGISLREFNELPIPYIWSVVRTHAHFNNKSKQ